MKTVSNQTAEDAVAVVDALQQSVDIDAASAAFLGKLRNELNNLTGAIARAEALKHAEDRRQRILSAKYTPKMIAALETILKSRVAIVGKPSIWNPNAVPSSVIRALEERGLVFTSRPNYRGALHAKIGDRDESTVRQIVERAKTETKKE